MILRDGERLDHRRDERIALGRADHRERDAGVARGRFDDGLAGLQQALLLRVVDDRERQPVLDGRQRIERLDLDVDRDVLRRNAVQLDDGCVADRVEDAFVDHGAAL
jgi:hypothetical protein